MNDAAKSKFALESLTNLGNLKSCGKRRLASRQADFWNEQQFFNNVRFLTPPNF
jgi:hypothetical protein